MVNHPEQHHLGDVFLELSQALGKQIQENKCAGEHFYLI